ncbi:MAG: response regulator transcription factor [Bacteroidota bacterium]
MIMDDTEELRVLIVDDEEHSRLALVSLLREFCPSVHIEATVSNITDARRAILQYAPDAVFLDVEMPPEGTGFDLLESIHPSFLRFAVVFITGHREYAFQALRANAVDFLPKPVDIDDLQKAVAKLYEYKRSKRLEEAGRNVRNLLKSMAAQQQAKGVRLLLPTPDGMRIVHSEEVAFLTITPHRTDIQFANGESFSSGVPLKIDTHELLDNGFVRTSIEHFVNSSYIQSYIEKKDGGKVVLKNGHTVVVAPFYKDGLFDQLKI